MTPPDVGDAESLEERVNSALRPSLDDIGRLDELDARAAYAALLEHVRRSHAGMHGPPIPPPLR